MINLVLCSYRGLTTVYNDGTQNCVNVGFFQTTEVNYSSSQSPQYIVQGPNLWNCIVPYRRHGSESFEPCTVHSLWIRIFGTLYPTAGFETVYCVKQSLYGSESLEMCSLQSVCVRIFGSVFICYWFESLELCSIYVQYTVQSLRVQIFETVYCVVTKGPNL